MHSSQAIRATAAHPVPVTTAVSLRRWNFTLSGLHAIQAVGILALATAFALPVTASFLAGPPGTPPAPPTTLFDIPVAWGVALFLLLSAGFHGFIALPRTFERYLAGLASERNFFRWTEYSLSSTVMIVLIAMITGISDVAALIGIAAANAAMILFGAVQERYESPGGSLWPFWLGSIVGIAPWIAIGVYLWSPGSVAEPPAFVYVIFVSLFAFFNVFALNMWLQYRQVGRWRSYLVGEKAYMVLSLVAKSALAWQVFAGTLAG
ncbi:MAG TPA: heliorhodopsin HeR [Candidatus Limnocylindrales bacterium]